MSAPEIEVTIPIDGIDVLFTQRNSVVYRHAGCMTLCDCILIEDELNGYKRVLFNSVQEQEDLIFFGWSVIEQRDPDIEILEAYYRYHDLDPISRN